MSVTMNPSRGTPHLGVGEESAMALDNMNDCPACGQTLYRTTKSLFSKVVKRVPLSVPGHVERGQCLDCSKPSQQQPSQQRMGNLKTTGLEDEDEYDYEMAPLLLGIVQHSEMVTAATDHASSSSAIYSGTFNDYGERHGKGTMTWQNGDCYTGEFFNGVRHGHGTLAFASGGEYVGDWECNYMHGDGTRRFANGDVYVGTYHNSKRHGQGRFYFSNGDMFMGTWVDDDMTTGRYYYASGQRFEGGFKNGKRHGKGKLQKLDGSLDIFIYDDDQRRGPGIRWSPDRSTTWILKENGTIKNKSNIAEAVSFDYGMQADSAAVSSSNAAVVVPSDDGGQGNDASEMQNGELA